MAKTAILNKETRDLVGVAESAGTIKMVLEGAGLTEEQVELVTAKSFQPDDRYKTFKDMCARPLTAEEQAAKDEEEKAKAEAKAAKDKEKADAKAAKAANKGTRAGATALTGEYHLVKPLPPTAADHPKMPIWEAIVNNTTVEAAKAACPAENPKRATNGVYTFASEFRYFLRTGYVAMGPKGENDPAENAAAAADASAEDVKEQAEAQDQAA